MHIKWMFRWIPFSSRLTAPKGCGGVGSVHARGKRGWSQRDACFFSAWFSLNSRVESERALMAARQNPPILFPDTFVGLASCIRHQAHHMRLRLRLRELRWRGADRFVAWISVVAPIFRVAEPIVRWKREGRRAVAASSLLWVRRLTVRDDV